MGAYVLAALFACPVFMIHCVQQDGAHRIGREQFAARMTLPRGRHEKVLDTLVADYALRPERLVLATPLPWFNFFEFWDPRRAPSDAGPTQGDVA